MVVVVVVTAITTTTTTTNNNELLTQFSQLSYSLYYCLVVLVCIYEHQPFNCNIINRVKLLQDTLQLGLWAAA